MQAPLLELTRTVVCLQIPLYHLRTLTLLHTLSHSTYILQPHIIHLSSRTLTRAIPLIYIRRQRRCRG